MQSIGERLEEARKKQGIALREAAEATKIRGEYLQHLESNKFDLGLTDLYVRGFLRTYAHFLKLPADKILADYTALHRGDPRQRAINSEVYGRMEIPPPATGKPSDEPRAEPAPATAATTGNRPAAAARPVPPRTMRPPGGTHPATPTDQVLIFKLIGVVGGGVLLIGLVIWGLVALISPSKPTAPVTQSVSAVVLKFKIIAVGPVKVSLQQKSDNAVLFDGTLNAGDSREVPRRDSISITAIPQQNLLLEIDGKQYPMPAQSNTAELPLPPK